MHAIFTLVILFIAKLYAEHIGESCIFDDTRNGTCRLFSNCPNAKAESLPKICSFQGKHPIICCGMRISEQKCNSWKVYKESKFIRRFIRSIIAGGGGVDSLVKEFPHMAALGYGEATDKKWFCGGSLISEKFVLTAAHCLSHRGIGLVNFVRLGDLNLRSNTDDAKPQDFEVVRRIKHPAYKASLQYNDIAILELDRAAELNKYVQPACLQTTKVIKNPYTVTATGWGRLSVHGPLADHLQKLTLQEAPHTECKKFYNKTSSLRLPEGILDDSQICAVGDKQDTCQGDSGGPLQVKPVRRDGVYIIIGVTSFGKACLISSAPGVYTRVSNYVDWIESVVWKNQ